jgi:hypothetical protein
MTSGSELYNDKLNTADSKPTLLVRMRAFIDRHPWLLPTFLFSTLVLLLWLPVGFYTTGLVEEWSFYGLAAQGVPLVPASAWSAAHTLRPFVAFAWQLGYWVTPNSFLGLNLVMMAIFIAKALSFYALLRLLLPESRVFALLTAAVFLLYPADSMNMMLRGISIHFALLTYLGAALLLIFYWRRPRWYFMLGAWGLLVVSLGIYEVSYIFTLLSPLLLLVVEKRLMPTRRMVRVSLLWYVPLIVYLVWYLIILRTTTDSYQQGHFSNMARGSLGEIASHVLRSIQHLLDWNFLSGWRRALEGFAVDPAIPVIALGMSLLFIVASLLLWQRQTATEVGTASPPLVRRYLLAALFGFVIMGIAYGPYALLQAFFLNTERVFYYTAVGAAVGVMALLYIFSLRVFRSQIVFIIVGSILIGVATAGAIAQHLHYADWSHEQQRLFASVVQTVPQFDEDATLIVYQDGDPERINRVAGYKHPMFYVYHNFENALNYFYRRDGLHTLYCSANRLIQDETPCEQILEDTPADELILVEYRPITGESAILDDIPDKYSTFDLSEDYNPDALVDADAAPPELASSVLADCYNLSQCATEPVQEVALDFDIAMFNTFSWLRSERNPGGVNFQWTLLKDADLSLPALLPGNYHISLGVYATSTPENLSDFDLKVNGYSVPLTRGRDAQGKTTFAGLLPAQSLNDRSTELQFSVDKLESIGNFPPLGIAIDWLRIEPTEAPDVVQFEFDQPIREPGWRGVETRQTGETFQWMTAEEASLFTSLQPETNYRLSVRVVASQKPDLLDSFGVAVDGHPIVLRRQNDERGLPIYSGFVGSQEIGQPYAELTFSTDEAVLPQDGKVPLSVGIDWVRIEPLTPQTTVDIEFDQPLVGEGWRGSETNPDSTTYQWMIAEKATLESLSLENDRDYVMRFRVINIIDPEILDGLTVEINGQPVELVQDADEVYSATYSAAIPQALLTENLTQIDFLVDELVMPEGGSQGLGLALDWVKINPAQP